MYRSVANAKYVWQSDSYKPDLSASDVNSKLLANSQAVHFKPTALENKQFRSIESQRKCNDLFDEPLRTRGKI